MSKSNQNFTPLCYHDILHVTLCVVLPLSIVLLSCTGIEEDGDDDYSDDYEVITMQGEADGGDMDNDGDDDDDDDDDQETEDAMGTNFALTSNNLGINYTRSY